MADDKNIIEEEENDIIDYRDEGDQEGGIFRWMSVFVVLLAVAGFFSLAWYAYKSGGEVTHVEDAELITAEASPVKEAPENPGGIEIPNQDKTVYGLVEGNKPSEGKGVEHILSSPETPIIQTDDSETGTWMSDEVKQRLKASDGESQPVVAEAREASGKETAKAEKAEAKLMEDEVVPAEIKAPQEEKVAEKLAVKPAPQKTEASKADNKGNDVQAAAKPNSDEDDVPTNPAKPSTDIKELHLDANGKAIKEDAAQPASVTEAKAASEKAKADESKQSSMKATEKEKVAEKLKEKETAVPAGGARVQLGAFKSEAEASGQWKKIEKKFSSDVSGKSHYIVRADLGSKGIFYRLQLAPFDSMKDADSFCLGLVSEGQGCMPVKGK